VRLPQPPAVGPFRRAAWQSPVRGPWLTSLLGSALLPLIVICGVTGFLSHVAYDPELGENSSIGAGAGLDLKLFLWPSTPAWLYAVVQGLHVGSGLVAIPILVAKLWSVIPKLWERPAVRSAAHALERLSLALLVGGALFVFATGVLNIQVWRPWSFSFVPAHYYAAFIFLAALALHLVVKLPVVRRTFKREGVVAPLRESRDATRPEPADAGLTAPTEPGPTTISRRGLLGAVGAGSAALGLLAAGQSIGGPLRPLALLAPRGGEYGDGPNDFPINKTAEAAGIARDRAGSGWRLRLAGARERSLSRDELLAMPQTSAKLPIACVEGWSTTQEWQGVPLRDLARLAGAAEDDHVFVESLQRGGAFSSVVLAANQVSNPHSLLALRVNGADLSLDHGSPARVIVPAAPGVHCTKWVGRMTFGRM
jgi:DMSO/TMAO reductase YedYZ molybdopterin-dependent catalytic subunit